MAICCSDPPSGHVRWTLSLLVSELKRQGIVTDAHCAEEPLICIDEAAMELKQGLKQPIPLKPGQDAKEDYHYQRNGTRAIFLFINSIRGWRRVKSYEHRRRIEWAEEMPHLLLVDYPNARKVKLVCDNLNTHHIASLYEAFPAQEAHQLARRLEIHYTLPNGSWLNIAEIELSVLHQQCLERRLPCYRILSTVFFQGVARSRWET